MTDLATLNKVQYGGLDFNTLSDELLSRLQIQFASDFNDFALSSMGIMLLDVVAFGLDSLAFYLDRRATDNFLSTARTRKSVAKLTRQLGYKMRGAASSSCSLSVALTEAPSGGYAFNVAIPKGFKFKGPDDLIFEAAEEVVFPAGWPAGSAGVNELSVPVYQGETVTETFTSSGEANQIVELRKVKDGQFVTAGTVEVAVDGESWAERDFLEYEATNHFEVEYNGSPVSVRFGDSVTGNIPKSGASISVTYVVCRGKEGRVAADTIQSEVTPLTASFTTIPLTINNNVSADGGDDLEDLDQAKASAGRVFKTRQVAITQEDYQALAGSFSDSLFGRVAVAQAFSSRSSTTDLALNGYLDTIKNSTIAYVDDVETAVTAIETGFASLIATLSTTPVSLSAPNGNLLGNLLAIASAATSANTSTTSGKTAAKTTKNKISDISQSASTATTQINAAKTQIGLFTVGATNTIMKATLDTLTAQLDTAISAVTQAASTATIANTNIDATITALDSITTLLATIGLDTTTAGTELYKAKNNQAALVAIVGSDPASTTTGLYQHSNVIQTRVTTEVKTDVIDAIAGINDHFSKILSSDCKANVVTVPLLSKNAGGFYVAPSLSLIASLQKFLDSKKEVTHTVFVVSGSPYLVRPKLTIRFGLKPGFSASVVAASVAVTVDTLLRDRKFGQALYNSDIVDALQALAGVAYSNVTIDGYTRDGSLAPLTDKVIGGNLIIADSEVITKATDDASSPQISIEADT